MSVLIRIFSALVFLFGAGLLTYAVWFAIKSQAFLIPSGVALGLGLIDAVMGMVLLTCGYKNLCALRTFLLLNGLLLIAELVVVVLLFLQSTRANIINDAQLIEPVKSFVADNLDLVCYLLMGALIVKLGALVLVSVQSCKLAQEFHDSEYGEFEDSAVLIEEGGIEAASRSRYGAWWQRLATPQRRPHACTPPAPALLITNTPRARVCVRARAAVTLSAPLHPPLLSQRRRTRAFMRSTASARRVRTAASGGDECVDSLFLLTLPALLVNHLQYIPSWYLRARKGGSHSARAHGSRLRWRPSLKVFLAQRQLRRAVAACLCPTGSCAKSRIFGFESVLREAKGEARLRRVRLGLQRHPRTRRALLQLIAPRLEAQHALRVTEKAQGCTAGPVAANKEHRRARRAE